MLVSRHTLCLAAASCLLQALLASSQSLPTAWTVGIATNYGGAQDGMDPSSPSFGTLDGSCGYGLLSQNVYPYWTVAALSPANKYSIAGPSQACGQCFEIQCLNSGGQFAGRCSSSQSVTVTITDSCPECEADHIDIQALTFNKIAPMAIGRIDIQYRRVDCTPPLPVSIEIDNNVGVGGWLRLVVEKTAGFGGISSVSIRQSGSQSWTVMTNKYGSAWEVSNAPALPWDFSFTSDSQQVIVADGLINQNGQIGSIPTGVQFSLSGSSGSTSISYDSASAPGAGGTSSPSSTSPSPPLAAPPSPQPAGVTNVASQGGGCPCVDVTPAVAGGASISCSQQKAYGKCNDSWMVNGNYCQLTCGTCPASCSGGSATPPSAAGAAAASGGQSPPPATPPSGGQQSPPAPGQSPPPTPAGTTQPPVSGGASPPPVSIPTASGSVQTYSVGGSASPSPPLTQSPPPTPSGSGGCTDNPPPGANGQSCPQLASQGACYSSIGDGFCLKSCYRSPCTSG